MRISVERTNKCSSDAFANFSNEQSTHAIVLSIVGGVAGVCRLFHQTLFRDLIKILATYIYKEIIPIGSQH